MTEEKFYKQTTLPSYEELSQEPLELPKTIGPFKVESLLQKGGMSLLYLGLDPKTKEPVAIKVLRPSYLNHPEMVDHFLWEARIIGLSDHPNIVKLKDQGKWEGGLYIAMEFIQGVSLRQFLIQQSFSIKRCIDIILQVAYALCHLHTHGVIHRDLKPENILIANDGQIKVIDFGIAQVHEDEPTQKKGSSQVMGTPSYMSPEQKENPSNASFASDIFSLGVIAYELILGKLCYGMINLSFLPSGLQPILGKALAVSPKERYSDIVEFIIDLSHYQKSPQSQTDQPTGDLNLQWKESLSKSEQSLSLAQTPSWPLFDIGIAKDVQIHHSGFFLDAFAFANNTFALIQLQTQNTQIASTAHIAKASGMIKALLQPHIESEEPLDPILFVTQLNTLLCGIDETFSLNLLKLIPYQETLIYISCGPHGPLFHLPSGSQSPKTIHSENPFLGQDPSSEFTESIDTFADNDLLLFHNLDEKRFKTPLTSLLETHRLLSCARLAQTLLDEVKHLESQKEDQEDEDRAKSLIIVQALS